MDLKNVHKTYLLGVEGVPALRGVSLSIQKGEWVVIYGTSGGGYVHYIFFFFFSFSSPVGIQAAIKLTRQIDSSKTSLLNICGTIDKPTKGEVEIGGLSVNDKTPDDQLASIRLEKLYVSARLSR